MTSLPDTLGAIALVIVFWGALELFLYHQKKKVTRK